MKVTLFDGSYHDVDSNENAFKMAASFAFKDACRKADPVLLEPMMAVEVETPEDYMGDVMGDLIIHAEVLFKGWKIMQLVKVIRLLKCHYQKCLVIQQHVRSLSQGRATYSMEFKHYAEAPRNIAEAVINEQRFNFLRNRLWLKVNLSVPNPM